MSINIHIQCFLKPYLCHIKGPAMCMHMFISHTHHGHTDSSQCHHKYVQLKAYFET